MVKPSGMSSSRCRSCFSVPRQPEKFPAGCMRKPRKAKADVVSGDSSGSDLEDEAPQSAADLEDAAAKRWARLRCRCRSESARLQLVLCGLQVY